MQFQVPQFIETEDKIIGPLTIKQFLYIAAAGAASFFLFFVLELWLWIVMTFIMTAVSAMLAFIKVNGRPMIIFIKSAFGYMWSPRIYRFEVKSNKKTETKLPEISLPKEYKIGGKPIREHKTGGLKNLFENINTSKTAIPKRELTLPPAFKETQKELQEKYEVVQRVTGEKQMARRVDYR